MKDHIQLLLCEDNEEIIMIIEFYLRSKNLQVNTCRSAEEAVEYLEKNTPTAMLLDLNVPEKGGRYVIDTLRKNQNPLPVILITGDADAENIARSLKLNGVIRKPFELNHLLNEIMRVISGREGM